MIPLKYQKIEWDSKENFMGFPSKRINYKKWTRSSKNHMTYINNTGEIISFKFLKTKKNLTDILIEIYGLQEGINPRFACWKNITILKDETSIKNGPTDVPFR